MSPRAAWRLETLGFTKVYEYAAGKADWGAAGLPLEGEVASSPTIGERVRRDVPTCGLQEHVGEAAARVRAGGWDTCIVVTDGDVVLGRLHETELRGDPLRSAEEAMRPGPSTFRPDVPAEQMLELMRERNLRTVPVTTSDGRLVGIARVEDLERRADPARLAE